MNKAMLAVAVAVAMSAPLAAVADTTLYGSLRLYANSGDGRDLDISNDASRVGVKGSISTAIEGVDALYRIEAFVGQDNGLDASATQNEASFGVDGRLAYVGLTGGFGTVTVGQQWSPLYNDVTGAADMTLNNAAETQVYLRMDSLLAYTSPTFGGFQFAAGAASDTDTDSGEDADHYQLTAKYTMGPVTFAVGADEAGADAGTDVQAASVSYSAKAITLVALVQNVDTDLAGAESASPFELAASYVFGGNTLIGTYYDADAAVDTTGFNLELHHVLGEYTTLYANVDSDDVDGENTTGYGLGLKVDF